MGRRLIRRVSAAVAAFGLATAAAMLASPGVAAAGGGASGSVSPHTVQRGDDASFTITCHRSSSRATLTSTSIGLPSNIAMVKVTSTFFELDVTIPWEAPHGTHRLSMHCSDGSFVNVMLVVSPSGSADTGDGTMSGGASTTAIVAGGVLVLGAGAGGIALRRRSRAAR